MDLNDFNNKLNNDGNKNNQPNNLKRYGLFSAYVAKAQNSLDTNKSKKIRNNLIGWGLAGTILFGIGFFACFILFAFITSTTHHFSIIPLLFLPICPILAGISSMALQAGLAIVVSKAGANFLNLNGKCPKCGDPIEEGEMYCNKCGEPLLISHKCKECGFENRTNDVYCKQCGKPLEDAVRYEERNCPYCGKHLEENDKFCKSCGKKI